MIEKDNQENKQQNCSQYNGDEEKRRHITFPAFASSTDEKKQTIKVAEGFLNAYLSAVAKNTGLISNDTTESLKHCQVVDLGSGNGELSVKFAIYMQSKCENIRYEAIDSKMAFVNSTKEKLLNKGFNNTNIVNGNFSTDDINKLVDNPTLLIASQVIFHSENVTNFIETIIKKMGMIAIVIGQATGSFINHMCAKYGEAELKTGAEETINNVFSSSPNISSIKFLYGSVIELPSNITIENLKYIASMPFENITEPNAKLLRYLMEFIPGTSLERLACMNILDSYIKNIYTHLSNNQGKIHFWNYITIAIPSKLLEQKAMRETWKVMQKKHLSENIPSFKFAIEEGNYEITRSLIDDGIDTCSLQNDENISIVKSLLKKLEVLFLYELRLSEYASILDFLGFQLDNTAKYRVFNSSYIIKMINYNSSYPLLTGQLLDKLFKEPSIISAAGQYYNNVLNKWIDNTYLFAFVLCLPVIIIQDLHTANKMALSLLLMYISIYEKFLGAVNSAIHQITGETLIFHLYLFETENHDSLKFQNSNDQTALMLAIQNNDTEKATKMLMCDPLLVKEFITIVDIHGRTAFHYASQYNNLEITKTLLNAGVNLDEEAHNYFRQSFDFLFLAAKLLYLSSYFTGWINNDRRVRNYEMISISMLWAIYASAKYSAISFPENIYFHLVLIKLNPFGSEENYLYKKSEAYNGYTHDTALHLSCNYNHTEIANYLITKGAEINKFNTKGESALHLAAANNNIELLDSLLKANADINSQKNSYSFYPIIDLSIKAALLCNGYNSILKIVSDAIFLKVMYDEMFGAFSNIKSATPLHYAVGGINLSRAILNDDINLTNDTEGRIVTYLLENGADPNLRMSQYGNTDTQIIPYMITKAIIVAAHLLGKNIPLMYQLPLLFLIQGFYPYEEKEIKPIDLIKCDRSNDQSCNYLQQYTIQNGYKSSTELSFLDFRYFLYKFGVSDNDIIHMDKYGMYKGGSGNDTFIVYKNFIGNDQGYHLIINDYSINEDRIVCKDCGDIFSIKQDEITIMNTTSAHITINNNISLVLLGVQTIIEEINLI